MFWDITMEYSEERGTWNVFVDNEWYFEGTYEQCCEVMDNFYSDLDDEYYEEDYYEEDYYDDPVVCEGWAQQDTIDMYRRER